MWLVYSWKLLIVWKNKEMYHGAGEMAQYIKALLFQRTKVWFLAPTWRHNNCLLFQSQGIRLPLLTSKGTRDSWCTDTHVVHVGEDTHTPKLNKHTYLMDAVEELLELSSLRLRGSPLCSGQVYLAQMLYTASNLATILTCWMSFPHKAVWFKSASFPQTAFFRFSWTVNKISLDLD